MMSYKRDEALPRRTPRPALVVAMLSTIALTSLVAAPAWAAGGFTEKVTPFGCAETDYSGSSSNTGVTKGSGYTKHGAIICPPPGISLGLNLTKGSSSTGYSSTFTSAIISKTITGTSGAATHGFHQIDGGHPMNT